MREPITTSPISKRIFYFCLCGLLAAALLIAYIGMHTDLDLRLSDWMYDASQRRFPLKDTWFASVFMHRWAKYFFIALGLATTLFLLIASAGRRTWMTDDLRRKTAVVVLAFFAIPLLISIMKSQSIHHCPWDLERYGGFAPYLRLFDALPTGIKAGHCFPAGHVSSSLWLAAFCVFLLPQRPHVALAAFVAGLTPGLLLGWEQQLRGAHFLTHTLWSAWIAALIILLLCRLLLVRR
jgi:membrane-associated PAP2 superfamily phosphatase